jgi:hypothetical protein
MFWLTLKGLRLIWAILSSGPGYRSRYSDSLRVGRSVDRIPSGASFSVPVQTGPGAHPASCTVGTGSVPWVKRQGRGVDNPPPPSSEVKGRAELYLNPTSGLSCPILGYLYIYFTFTLSSSWRYLRRSVQRRLSHIFMVSVNSSIRVTSKLFGTKSAIFTKMWVRYLWHWALHIEGVDVTKLTVMFLVCAKHLTSVEVSVKRI